MSAILTPTIESRPCRARTRARAGLKTAQALGLTVPATLLARLLGCPAAIAHGRFWHITAMRGSLDF